MPGADATRPRDAARAKAYGLLKAILQTAEDDELIPRNPCRLKGAGSAAKRRESIALTPGELAALAEAMPLRWRALTLVSGWCGLRIAEAAGLRRGDVDVSASELRVVQTAQYIGTPAHLVIGPPKSVRGARTVFMPSHVTSALAAHLERAGSVKAKDFVWTRADGQPISRHTVLAADAGASQATLQARMGHADPKVSSIYLHTSRSHDRELAAALSRMAERG